MKWLLWSALLYFAAVRGMRRPVLSSQSAADLGALGGTRTPNLLIRSKIKAVQRCPLSSGQARRTANHLHPAPAASRRIQIRC
jgi:hypothetical protein